MSTSTEQAPDQSSGLPKRRRPGMVLACVAVIVIVLVGGSMFWMIHGKASPTPGSSKAQPTKTVVPTWAPTAITPPALSIFYDTFSNNYHGWLLDHGSGYFRILDTVHNALILADTNPDTPLIESVPTLTNLDNYVVSTDFTINQGDANDGMGLYLRGDSRLDQDYRVDVNGNGTIDVAKEFLNTQRNEEQAMLVPPVQVSVLNRPGQENTLTVILLGPSITVEINNIVVAMATDTDYTNGQIALFVRHGATSLQGVTISFTRFEIDRLASPFMTPTPTPSPTLTPSATASATPGQP